MKNEAMNGLAASRSAYLRSAQRQPVQWREWGPEAFADAVQQDKPVLLDIGAVWCHWCHVMDRESYEDVETARLINEHFIAIKVDRDERPDVDTRYQAAVAAISGQGGWPLTAFLTPEGKPFFGGGYFPPVDGHGRPSLRRVLMTMAEAFERTREDVFESAASVMAAIEHNETFDGRGAAETGVPVDQALVSRMIASALGQFDQRHGGFGSQPKFPHPAALHLLLDTAGRAGPQAELARRVVLVTLQKMSRGGIYDHLAGGFHRYSVDERWVIPHFEKMSYDNSELIGVYVRAFQATQEPECARIAREIMGWVEASLSDRKRGGFFASQDADESLDDDGDYFTWTQAEARAVLTPEEFAIAAPFYDIGELGDMHHNPLKNVLHVQQSLAAVAQQAGVSLDDAAALLLESRRKLLLARSERRTPFIDQTLYTAWNAMMISAFLQAARVLEQPANREFALSSLDRVLEAVWDGHSAAHVAHYGDTELNEVGSASAIPGVLDDYAFLGCAALDAWETCGEMTYFDAALGLGQALADRFYDEARGGFFDTEAPAPDEVRLGALSTRRKPLQDSPAPAGNSIAATLLLRLASLTGRADLREKAQRTLECFAGVVEHFGLYAASYGLAARRMLLPDVRVIVTGEGREATLLERATLEGYTVNRTVIHLCKPGPLPTTLAETIPGLPGYAESRVQALVCVDGRCFAPVSDPQDLRTILSDL